MLPKRSRRRTVAWAPSLSPFALAIAACSALAVLFVPVLGAQPRPRLPNPPASDPPALEAVTLMANHEIAVHHDPHHAHAFRFRSVERSARTGGHLWTEEVVEVDGGFLRRLIAVDGKPLAPAQQAAEDHRLELLAKDPSAFAEANRSRQKDEARVTQVLERMPKEFLFHYDGRQHGCERIAYRPNPAYKPSSFEDRVVHSMAGFVDIEEPSMRLCSVTGHLVKTVDFGWGLLGHVTQGSGFTLARSPVEPAVWRSTQLNLHFDGAIFFFKSISRNQHTVRSRFQPVPDHLNLQQAVALSLPSAQP